MNPNHPPPADMGSKPRKPSLLMTRDDIAHEYRCSRRQVSYLVASGELPKPAKIGKRMSRFVRADVMAAMNKSLHKDAPRQ